MNSQEIRSLKGISFTALIDQFFRDDYMEALSKGHHKHNDGSLEVYYNWYYDNPHQWAWEIHHPGYIRNEIRGIGHTLQEAIDDFIDCWSEERNIWDYDPFGGIE